MPPKTETETEPKDDNATEATEATEEASDEEEEATAPSGDEIESSSDGAKAEGEEEKKEEEAEAEPAKVVTKVRVRKEFFDLKSTWVNSGDFVPSAELIEQKVGRLQKLTQADKDRALAEEAKNKLETFILQTMTQCGEEEVEEVSTEEEREKLKSECMDAEDWLYSDGENALLADFQKKFEDLAALYEPISVRLFEKEERPAIIKKVTKKLTEYKELLGTWKEKKPWISAERLQNVTSRCEDMEGWLKDKVAEQSKLKDSEDPILKSAEIGEKLKVITKQMKFLQKIPKPKTKGDKEDDEPLLKEDADKKKTEEEKAKKEEKATEEAAAGEKSEL